MIIKKYIDFIKFDIMINKEVIIIKTEELFLSDESIAIDFIRKYEYPYQALPHIKDYIIELGKTLSDDYELKGENIWIHKTAKIAKNVDITGPCIIDEGAEIRPSAFVRGSAIIGKNCVFGNSCEIKNAIIFNNSQVPHFNYVGDSILGYHTHMAAGSITSNLKISGTPIIIKNGEEQIETNMRKIGAILGDYAEVGCNSVLNPGTIIGHHTIVYPLVSVRGVIPSKSIVKDMNNIVPRRED